MDLGLGKESWDENLKNDNNSSPTRLEVGFVNPG
jgi:hypothetical protein